MPGTTRVFTIGYSGHTPASFLEALMSNDIAIVIDVRMTPISRKRGFSKSALASLLNQAGIKYTHFRCLGSPKPLRRALREHHDYNAFFDAYRAHLADQWEELHAAACEVNGKHVCLMCVEHLPEECHRSALADALVNLLHQPTEVCHLAYAAGNASD